MSSHLWSRSFHIFVVLCASFANAATESGATSTVNSSLTNGELSHTATPAPGGVVNFTEAENSTSVGVATPAATVDSISVGTAGETVTVDYRAATTQNVSEVPAATTIPPVVTPEGDLKLHLLFASSQVLPNR